MRTCICTTEGWFWDSVACTFFRQSHSLQNIMHICMAPKLILIYYKTLPKSHKSAGNTSWDLEWRTGVARVCCHLAGARGIAPPRPPQPPSAPLQRSQSCSINESLLTFTTDGKKTRRC